MPLYNAPPTAPTAPAPQQQADWSEANTGDLDFIKNKPAIPAADNGVWIGGVWKSGAVAAIVTGTVAANGTLSLDLTKADLSAIFGTEVFGDSLALRAVEGDYPVAVSAVTIAGDRKSASCTVKRVGTAVTILTISVLAAPVLAVGTVVKGVIWGR